MTDRRKELLKRGREATKGIEGIKTYSNDGSLVLSPIENANEDEYILRRVLEETFKDKLEEFSKRLSEKNEKIEDIDMISVVGAMLDKVISREVLLTVKTKNGKDITI